MANWGRPQGNVGKHFRCADDGLSSLGCPASAWCQGTHITKISLEVNGKWRAHCFGLQCLSLVLIASHVLSYVVIALIANICWLLTVCHCAKRFTHITSLSCYNPVKLCCRYLTNGKTEVWEAMCHRGVSGSLMVQDLNPSLSLCLICCATCTASGMSA